ncbi:MAG: flagellar basal body P-ring formation chaperone FlgA [Burkholderiaceae bacterium]
MLHIRLHSHEPALRLALVLACALPALSAWAQQAPAATAASLDAGVLSQVQELAQSGARAALPEQARVEVSVGQLDPRLKLAPCRQVQAYLPPGLPMWGRSRIGLRCLDGQQAGAGAAGQARWNVSLPVLVKVYAKVLVAAAPLPAGTVLTQAELAQAEIDIAAEPGAVFTEAADLAGRTLARPLGAGDAVRSASLKQRQWFAAGTTVTVQVLGSGFAIASEGQAMAPGMEGQDVKVRFESGRIVTGRAVGERRVEVLL